MESNVVLLLPAPHDCYLPAMPPLTGEVYRYENESDVVPDEKYRNYVGATEKPKGREGQWDCPSSNYAGPKIAAARKIIPLEDWKRYSFPVFDTDPKRLKKRLKEYETYYIAVFDSFEHGYNGNRGGVGCPAVVIIKVTAPNGEWRLFNGYNAVGAAFGLTSGGVQNYVDKKANHTNKDGFKFERLN